MSVAMTLFWHTPPDSILSGCCEDYVSLTPRAESPPLLHFGKIHSHLAHQLSVAATERKAVSQAIQASTISLMNLAVLAGLSVLIFDTSRT